MRAARATLGPSLAALEPAADAALHVVALIGTIWAGQLAWQRAAADPGVGVALAVYVLGMALLVAASGAYNLTLGAGRAPWLRRADHASIFVMIAGTYTPFCVLGLGGTTGLALLVAVWTLALAGAVLRLLGLPRRESVASLGYLAVGWVALVAVVPLVEALPPLGLALLALGGVLYSVGVVFYLWRELPFHRVIWHGFVLAGAATHAAAVFTVIAPPV